MVWCPLLFPSRKSALIQKPSQRKNLSSAWDNWNNKKIRVCVSVWVYYVFLFIFIFFYFFSKKKKK